MCPHDKTKTAETKIAKLGTGIVHYDISPTNEYQVKVTGSQSAQRRDETAVRHRLVEDDRVVGVSYALVFSMFVFILEPMLIFYNS